MGATTPRDSGVTGAGPAGREDQGPEGLVRRYRKHLEPQADGTVLGSSPELRGVAVSADNDVACLERLGAAMLEHARTLVELGHALPVPLVDQDESLTEQVNVRLTAREKADLNEEARRSGRSQSEVLRDRLRKPAFEFGSIGGKRGARGAAGAGLTAVPSRAKPTGPRIVRITVNDTPANRGPRRGAGPAKPTAKVQPKKA